MPDNERERMDLFCSTCNVLVEATVATVAVGDSSYRCAPETDLTEGLQWELRYNTAFCGRCRGAFLVRTRVTFVEGNYFDESERTVLYPAQTEMQLDHVPQEIVHAYQQAARAFRAGLYDASASMCRKCVEGLCSAFQCDGRNLKQKLESLEGSGVIDVKLLAWADELRIIGNDAAHDVSMAMSKNDARDALGFVEAILMYAFTLNARFEEFRARRRAPTSKDAG